MKNNILLPFKAILFLPKLMKYIWNNPKKISNFIVIVRTYGLKEGLSRVKTLYRQSKDSREMLGVYEKWLQEHYPIEKKLKEQHEQSKQFIHQPLISVIMPVYNPRSSFLEQAITSVKNQSYPFWELCICDDASTNPEIQGMFKTVC